MATDRASGAHVARMLASGSFGTRVETAKAEGKERGEGELFLPRFEVGHVAAPNGPYQRLSWHGEYGRGFL